MIEGPIHGGSEDAGRPESNQTGKQSARSERPTFSGGLVRPLLDAAPIGLWLADSSGRCTYVNAYWCRALQTDARTLAGDGWTKFVHADDLARVRRKWTSCVQAFQPYEQQYRFVRSDGEPVWVLARATPIGSLNARSGYIGGLTDISSQKHAEAELTQAQKMHAVGELAGGVAHDFNSLLTAIHAGIQFGLDEVAGGTDAHGALTTAQDAAERAGKLTQQLLSLSRKRTQGVRTDVDVNALVKETTGLVRHAISGDVKLRTSLCKGRPIVHGDETQIAQVILNFALNARDAMPDGGILRISTAVQNITSPPTGNEGEFVVITVTDTGTGMPAHVVERAFEPFFTTKPEGKGTGLGLAVAYRSATENGGWTDISSIEGTGTSASVFLPCRTPERKLGGISLPTGTETILVVDDMESVLMHTRAVLERIGYHVLSETEPLAAVERFMRDRNSIDAVVTDLVMPGISGRELLMRFRAMGSSVPVVLMTGDGPETRRDRLMAEGFAELLAKPFEITTLANTVRRVLDAHKNQRE